MPRAHDFGFRIHLAPLRRVLEAMLSTQWLAVLVVFFVLYGPFLLKYGWQYRDIDNIDLPSFYTASVSAFRHGESPYDLGNMRLLLPHNVTVLPYLYPPPSLLVFYPLSVLSYAQARHAVLLINHVLFLVLVWVLPLRLLRSWPRRGLGVFALCIAYSLTFYPVSVTLNHGQVTILLLAFLVLFWLLARNGNAVLAALFLALAILLKTYPIIIIPMLFLIGRRREGAYTGAWLGLATFLSLMVLPVTVWHDWLTKVLPAVRYMRTPAGLFSPAGIWNKSLNGFFARALTESRWSNPIWVNPALAEFLTYSVAGLVAVATGIAVWRSRRRIDSLDRTVIVTLPAMYLVAPFSWEHHLVYLLPSILVLLNSHSSSRLAPKLMFYALCVASAVMISMPCLFQFKFYAVVVLWVLCVFAIGNKDIELVHKTY